jgi:hypothetical protein
MARTATLGKALGGVQFCARLKPFKLLGLFFCNAKPMRGVKQKYQFVFVL